MCGGCLAAREIRLERVHARADEQRRGVVARDQGRGRLALVVARLVEALELLADLVGGHTGSVWTSRPRAIGTQSEPGEHRGQRHERPAGAERVDRVGGRRRPDDRHPGGEPERGADLAEHRLHADPGRELVGPQRGRRRGGEGRQHQPDARAGEDLPRQDRGQVGGLRRRVGDEPQAAGREHEAADRAERGGLAAVGEAARGERGGRREQRAGRERDAGLQDRVVPHLGEEEDVAEQQAGEAGGEQQRREPGERERRHPQERELDDRRGMARAAAQEDRAEHRRRREDAEHALVPVPVLALGEPEREQGDRRDEHRDADQVGQPRGARVADLGREPQREHDRDQAERDVDEEDQPPADLDQQAAERRRDRRADGADARPRADHRRALLGRPHRQHEPERVRRQRRRADALEHARGHERLHRRRDRAQRGAEREQREPDDEQPPAPVQVAEPARRGPAWRRTRSRRRSAPTTARRGRRRGSRAAGPGTRC